MISLLEHPLTPELKDCGPEAVAISPDGEKLAYGGGTHYATPKYRKETTHVVIVDIRSGSVSAIGKGHPHVVQALAFSPDGKSIVSTDYETGVMSWDSQSGEKLAGRKANELMVVNWAGQAMGHHGSCRFICVSSKTGRVVTTGGIGLLTWKNVPSLKKGPVIMMDPALDAARSVELQDRIQSVALSPDAKFAVTAGATLRLARWELDSGSLVPVTSRTGMFFSLDYTHDGQHIVALEAFGAEPHIRMESNATSYYPWRSSKYQKKLVLLDSVTLNPVWEQAIDGSPFKLICTEKDIVVAGLEESNVTLQRFSYNNGTLNNRLVHEYRQVRPASLDPKYEFFPIVDFALAANVAAVATRGGMHMFYL